MMNIKRMLSCIAVVVAALLLAVSCGNMLEAPKAEGVEGGTGRLSVSMGDGRAVFPEELKFEADKELTFTLSGSLDGGEDKEIRSWSAEGDKTAYQVMVADTSLTVEAGRWSFTLQAKRGGTVVATASKDLEVKGGQENRLSFGTMAYSDEGTGTVTVTISWNEGEQVTSVVAGLYNASDDTMVENTQQTLTPAESKVTYAKSGVPAGTYRLKAQMKQGETVIGTYSELVRVAGGLSSEAERNLESLNTLYTVTLDLGGQGELRTTFPETYNRSQTVTLPTAEQVASNTDAYSFAYWYEKDDTEKKAVTEIAGLDGNKTYCAYWQVAPVTFTLAGATVTLSTDTAGATIRYTTDGTDPKTSETRQEGSSVSITQQTTVKAYATKEELKESDVVEKTYLVVTFNANGGTFADIKDTKTETVESGQKATKPTDPTNGDMVLDGWYTSKDDGTTLADTAYSFDTPVEGDIILYAAWNGWDSDGNIVLKNKVMSKTSEVQVLSTAVYLKDLDNAASNSKIFVENRVGSIQPFVMGQYEVTQQLYEAVMESNPSNFTSDVAAEETQKLRPVENVSWYDAVVFCNELTKKVLDDGACVYYSDAGFTAVYTTDDGTERKTPYMDISKSGYRLPTEAEWEYAARAGDDTTDKITWSGTDTETELKEYAWYSGNSDSKTHQVGTKKPNSLNLYDMSGNVWEWCWDWYGDYSDGSVSDPQGGSSGDNRVYRGGGWNDLADRCSVSRRNYLGPSRGSSRLGFRLVRSAN